MTIRNSQSNDEVIKSQPELKKSDDKGNKDRERQVKHDLENKDESRAKLIAHDISAENGPHGAPKDTPKPPYWDLAKEDGKEVEPTKELLEKALDLVKKDSEK